MSITSAEAPRRQARSVRNDGRITDAAVALAAEEGWAGLAIVRVAARSGLSRPTVMTRFTDRAHLGATAWRERLAGPLLERLAALVAAADSATLSSDCAPLASALRPFLLPDESMRAVAELLIVSSYDADVAAAVVDTLHPAFAEWFDDSTSVTARVAARRGYVILTALGCLLEVRRHPGHSVDLTDAVDQMFRALGAQRAIESLPVVDDPHWDKPVDFLTDDRALERLLAATLSEVGALGYDAATIDRIAHVAGYTKGLVFSRYSSKRELFLDATRRGGRTSTQRNSELQRRLRESHPDGVVLAVAMREFMRPGREALRVVALEQCRLAWHDDEMFAATQEAFATTVEAALAERPDRPISEAEADVFIAMAQGIGTTLLAAVSPSAWTLAYQVVTVPLLDELPAD